MCPKDITDNLMPRRNDDPQRTPNNWAGVWEKYPWPTYNIGGEKMKNKTPTLCKRCLQFEHPKSTAEVAGNSAETAQNICRRE